MRQPLTVRFDATVVAAAKANAAQGNRTLTNYIETLMKRDLRLSETVFVDFAAPSDIRACGAVPLQGETDDALFNAALDAAGY
jgi:hypothetical protein